MTPARHQVQHLAPERGRDIGRMLVGSEGTLGVLTEAVVDLVRAPRARALAVLAYADESGAAPKQ